MKDATPPPPPRNLTPARHFRLMSRALLESAREKEGVDVNQTNPTIELTPHERALVDMAQGKKPTTPPPSSMALSSMAACMLRFAQQDEGAINPELDARLQENYPCPADGVCPFSGSKCPVHANRRSMPSVH